MRREDTNTATHAEHKNLMDKAGYDTEHGFTNLRDSDGTLGVTTKGGDEYFVSAYNNKTNKHSNVLNDNGQEISFHNESDAHTFIEENNKRTRNMLIKEESRPSSIDERVRLLRQKERHAAENAKREGRSSSGPILDSDNW